MRDPQPVRTTEALRIGEGDLTHNAVRELLQSAVKEKHPGENVWVWIRDVADDWVVYEVEDTDSLDVMRASYSIDDNNAVTLGDPEKVVANTEYVPVKESIQRAEGRVLEARGSTPEGGRVFAFQIIDAGVSRNGVLYPQHVLEAAAPLYEGAKAFDHHRTLEEMNTSSIDGLIGQWRNVEANQAGLQGELVLLPSATHTAEAIQASLDAQASGLPPLVGVSHDVMTTFKPDAALVGGRRVRECTAINQVLSTDVVADPSAGGRATRLVAGGTGDASPKEDTVNLKQLLALLATADDAERQRLLEEHADVIQAAGYTPEEVIAELIVADAAGDTTTTEDGGDAGGEGEPEPALAGAVEHSAESITGGILIREAVRAAQLPDRFVDQVRDELGARFTEAQVVAAVQRVKRTAEALERRDLLPGVPGVSVGTEAIDKKRDKLLATFEGRFQEGYHSLHEAFVDITGMHARDLFSGDIGAQIIRESYVGARYEGARVTESLSTGSWGEVLADVMNKRMVAEYQSQALNAWRKLVEVVPVTDFRSQKLTRIGGYGTLPTVGEGAPYQALPSPTDEQATYNPDKRGGTEDFTWEMARDDDLKRLVAIPKNLGRAAVITLHRFVFDALIADNPTIYDSVKLFDSASHRNTNTGSALAHATLNAARAAMRKQAAYGDSDDVLGLTPKYLLVPTALEDLAFQLCTSAVAIPGTTPGATNVPNLHQGMEPIVVDHWTDDDDWFLVADPASCPTIEIGFLDGKVDPELFVQDDPRSGSVFTADKITHKVRHVYGGAVVDYRGFQRRQA